MSNNKQSSVEWLMNQLTSTWYDKNAVKDIFEQAKAMHKEEIEDAWNDGAYGGGQFTTTHDTSEYYYNETFGGNK